MRTFVIAQKNRNFKISSDGMSILITPKVDLVLEPGAAQTLKFPWDFNDLQELGIGIKGRASAEAMLKGLCVVDCVTENDMLLVSVMNLSKKQLKISANETIAKIEFYTTVKIIESKKAIYMGVLQLDLNQLQQKRRHKLDS